MSALVLISTATGKKYRVTGNGFCIGRDMKNSLTIHDPTMSRVHCIIHKVKNKWYISDKSSGGTWLNDVQLQKHRKHPICHRDVIKLSENNTFKCNLPPKEKTQTDPVVAPLTAYQCPWDDSFLIDEVTCSICTEMFIEAVTMKCSHTFCSRCIKKWYERYRTCPNCRMIVTIGHRSLALDNIVNRLVKALPTSERVERQKVINARKAYTQ